MVFDLPGLVLVDDRRAVRVLRDGLDFRLQLDLHALLHQGFVQLGGDFFVFERHDARDGFKKRHFGAESPEDGSELDANGAAADHNHRLRNRLQTENFAVRKNRVAYRSRRPAASALPSPSRAKCMLVSSSVTFPSFSTDTRPGPAILPQPVMDSTLFFLNSAPMPPACFFTILSLRFEDRRPVDFYFFHFESKFLGALKVIVNVRVVQKYLRGNAADVQARAAQK